MELTEIARVFFALIAVLGLIGLVALAARKAGLISASGGLVRKRRLAIVETLAIDARRRVAIIKCDDKEHLVVLGANSETVLESGLESATVEASHAPAPENPFPTLKDFAKSLRPKRDAA